MRNFLSLLMLSAALCATNVYADNTASNMPPTDAQTKPVYAQLDDPAWITLYKPTYVLPFYYTDSPDNAVYQNSTPDGQNIKKLELNFQISLKVPLWHHFISPVSTLYMAYTQNSFWQAYNNSPFFRETDYEPELYVENKIDLPLGSYWQLKFLNTGAVHQSNGRGGDLERSWNRLYANAILANQNWLVSIKPWYVIHGSSMETHNPDIANYLGYGRVLVSYKYNQQIFSVKARNIFESNFKRGAVQATWSFPLTKHVKGYLLGFSGYGQSLIEYNHYTNSVGVGVALNDWV